MIVRFIKHDANTECPNNWYLNDKTWRGDIEDLKVPISLNDFIEQITAAPTEKVSFDISEFFIEGYSYLEKIYNEDMDNGRYMSDHGEVYICDLIHLYFPSGYPSKIYYQIKDES